MLQSERDAVLKATFRAPFNVRGCAYVRVLSFKGRWFCYRYSATPKMVLLSLLLSSFRIEDACWVWNDGGSIAEIDRFFPPPPLPPPLFFFLKVKLKVFTAD